MNNVCYKEFVWMVIFGGGASNVVLGQIYVIGAINEDECVCGEYFGMFYCNVLAPIMICQVLHGKLQILSISRYCQCSLQMFCNIHG